jgi:hypothetical protein
VTTTVIPASDPLSGSASGEPGASRSDAWAWRAFLAAALALLPLMVLASFDFGVTWDEKDRHRNGELVWQFLRGVRPRSAFAETGGHVYPGLFDTICAALETWLPGNRYVIRHAVNATFGWIGAVYCGRLAARFYGPWAGLLGMVLLAGSPRYFADSMNNPKDLPFAAMTVVALYYISGVSRTWPYVTPAGAIKIAVSLALALGVRVGALVYLGYFGLLIGALVVADRTMTLRRLADTAARALAVALAVLLIGTICWPWAGGAPLTRPFQALLGAANYPWDGAVLFMRREYRATELPWYYAPWWFVISTPPVVLIGAALSPVFFNGPADALRRAAFWGMVAFPLVMSIAMQSTLYDGIRHLEFIYPLLVILAVAGWTGLLAAAGARWLRAGAAALLGVGILTMVAFDIRHHPNQGVYFNAIIGGPRRAFGNYDMEYWGNCMLQAVEWTVDAARGAGTVVTVSGTPWHLTQLNAERFHEVSFTYPNQHRHHLHVHLARGPIGALRRLASQPALHQVRTADGAVLCTVTPGPAFGEAQALQRYLAGREPAEPASHP